MNDNRLIRCMTALMCDPWLLTPVMHKTLCDIVTAHIQSPEAQHAAANSMPANPSNRRYQVAGDNVAVIPIDGVIGRKFSRSLYSSGVTSVDVLARLVDEAAADPGIKGILLVMDTPGGTVQGTPEAGKSIKRATESKRVIAYADGQMCSAGYWLASQASAIYAWEESTVGSIGVYSAFLDSSRKNEQDGVKVEVFKSGTHKAMGFPGTSLSDEQRKMMQSRVDDIGVLFRSTVISGRGRMIEESVMQGQAFTAQECLKNGLIDSISTLEEALRDASKK